MSSFNFEGYSLWEWFKGNGKTIKEILKVGIPLGVSWVVTQSPALTTLITIVGKFVLDGVEYWIKE